LKYENVFENKLCYSLPLSSAESGAQYHMMTPNQHHASLEVTALCSHPQ